MAVNIERGLTVNLTKQNLKDQMLVSKSSVKPLDESEKKQISIKKEETMKNNSRPTGKTFTILAAMIVVALMTGTTLFAANATQTLTINATVSARAELTLSPSSISFADASPTTSPTIAANSTVAVTANVRTAANSKATLLAAVSGDLTSGGDSIPASNVSWTASAGPFIAGTLNKTTAQSAANFSNGSGSYNGTYTFTLANSWSYNTGSYAATVTYTLTAP
jgi:hypothetical protein